ncbi:hypothetical protein Hdeb2414_s0004g00133641 [Helianthus debilis subsp. tardiflorus]
MFLSRSALSPSLLMVVGDSACFRYVGVVVRRERWWFIFEFFTNTMDKSNRILFRNRIGFCSEIGCELWRD